MSWLFYKKVYRGLVKELQKWGLALRQEHLLPLDNVMNPSRLTSGRLESRNNQEGKRNEPEKRYVPCELAPAERCFVPSSEVERGQNEDPSDQHRKGAQRSREVEARVDKDQCNCTKGKG